MMKSPTKQQPRASRQDCDFGSGAAENKMITPPQTNSRESVYSKRTTKTNPLLHNSRSSASDEGRETRRKLFLKRAQEKTQEKREKARGLGISEERLREEEEVMRAVWINEERRRVEGQRREARILDIEPELELEEEEERFDDYDEEAVMVDEVAREEEDELESLLLFLPPTSTSSQDRPVFSQIETPYGSDDDEYDDIFMDVIEEEQRMSSQPHLQQRQNVPAYVDGGDEEMMDMS